MEREHHAVLTLFTAQAFAEGEELHLDDAAAHHARVRRVRAGDPVRLVDGAGHVAHGAFASLDKRNAVVRIDELRAVPAPVPLEVVVPVADRDRMLLAAEKCVELQVTAWRPAIFARSRSVATRGEGEKFRDKVVQRMRSALEQCGGAWLPVIHPERHAADALREARGESRYILDASGTALAAHRLDRASAMAVGPEGGFEPGERSEAIEAGWLPASLGATTLRFETAIIAGAAVVRAAQLAHGRT